MKSLDDRVHYAKVQAFFMPTILYSFTHRICTLLC